MDVFDFRADVETFDLATDSGDLVIGETTEQHKLMNLISTPGDWKENPAFGVSIENFINDERPAGIPEAVRKGLAADGMKNIEVSFDKNGELIINGHYE